MSATGEKSAEARQPTPRLLQDDLTTLPLEHSPGDYSATIGHALLHETAGVSIGVWEAGPGEDRDIEVDEVFLVLSGKGSVAFEDGSFLHLRPGQLVRLYAGERTAWHIESALRKLYVTLPG